jgi:hypothetical protein
MRNEYDRAILIIAKTVPDNSSTYEHSCPACGFNSSFSITRNSGGVLYHCFRSKCGLKGYVPTSLESSNVDVVCTKEPQPKQYKPIETVELDTNQLQFFQDKFELGDVREYGFKFAHHYSRIYMPVVDYYGRDIGHTLRGYKELADFKGPKSLHFKHSHTVPFGYYSFGAHAAYRIILVEDIISCIKITNVIRQDATKSRTLSGCVALLGTNLSQDMINFIKRKDVIWWLDKDALNKSVTFQKDLSLLLGSTGIITTDKDPKDMTFKEIKEILYD